MSDHPRRTRHPAHEWRDVLDLAFQQGRATCRGPALAAGDRATARGGPTSCSSAPGGVEWDTLARRVRLRRRPSRPSPPRRRRRRSSSRRTSTASAADSRRRPCPELDRLGRPPGRWEPWTPMAICLVQHVMFGSFGHRPLAAPGGQRPAGGVAGLLARRRAARRRQQRLRHRRIPDGLRATPSWPATRTASSRRPTSMRRSGCAARSSTWSA